jgi:hypothetical protein
MESCNKLCERKDQERERWKVERIDMAKYLRIWISCLCFMSAAQLIGQPRTESGHVRGYVVDPVGAGIGNASIFVRRYMSMSAAEKVELVDHSDQFGKFELILPAGAYDILIASPGFESKMQMVIVRTGENTNLKWKLIPHRCDFPGMNCDTVQ